MKSVLVTGASGGIGGAICRKFAEEGYFVGINYLNNKSGAESLAKDIGGFALQFDVSDYGQVKRAIDEFLNKTGKIDALINNAGVALPIKPVIDTTEEEYERVMRVNVKGVYNTIKCVIPHMLNCGGSIVNVSSMWGVAGGSCEALYSASKSAVIGLTKALAKEYASSDIRINAVAPGLIDTPMNANLSADDFKLAVGEVPLSRAGKPEEVADAVFFLVNNNYITGEILNISGGEVI